jgi:hypothetical protein
MKSDHDPQAPLPVGYSPPNVRLHTMQAEGMTRTSPRPPASVAKAPPSEGRTA